MTRANLISSSSILCGICVLCMLDLYIFTVTCEPHHDNKSSINPQRSDMEPIREGRTFGRIKRLQFALLPIMYKMGVMSTLLVVLTAISLKGLLIGATLLMLNLSAGLAKFYAWAHRSNDWSEDSGGGHKDVHVHIHNGQHEHAAYEHYDRADQYPAAAAAASAYTDPYRRRADLQQLYYWRGRPLARPPPDNTGLIGSIFNSIGAGGYEAQ